MRTSCLPVVVLCTLLLASVSVADEPHCFTTVDGIAIACELSRPSEITGKLPGVIFIHQGGSSRSEWLATRLFRDVVENGMVALAYDVRGHGQSDDAKNRSTLYDDPYQAPIDMLAAIEYLLNTGDVDPNRVAVVGASIGGNLSVVAAGRPDINVKTAVAISGKTSAAENLAGGASELQALRSVYYIAGEREQDGLRAAWARELHARTAEPRALDIVVDSERHGVHLFADDLSLEDRVLAWLQTQLAQTD